MHASTHACLFPCMPPKPAVLQAELDSFGLTDLHADSFVEVWQRKARVYYKPWQPGRLATLLGEVVKVSKANGADSSSTTVDMASSLGHAVAQSEAPTPSMARRKLGAALVLSRIRASSRKESSSSCASKSTPA